MKLFLMLTVFAFAAHGAPEPFTVGLEAFDQKGNHIQGVAASEDALYVSQMTRLVKLDWKGKVLATRAVTSHTGDIAWHDGELYTAVAVYPESKEGRVQVFDVLPAALRTIGARFVRATTKCTKSPPSVSCTFDFFDFK